jgi:hypothetical protein
MASYNGRISLALKDANNVRSNLLLHTSVPEATTVTQLIALGNLVATDYKAIGNAGVVDVTASVRDTSSVSAAASDADVSSGVVFDFPNNTGQLYGSYVPSFKDTLIVNGRPNLADAGVIAWAALVAATTTGINFTNPEYQALLAYVSAFRSIRKHRRKTHSSSLTPAP